MFKKSIINAFDLQGLTRIITDASVNITDLVEDMQSRIVHPPLLPSTPIQYLITDIARLSYRSTRFGMKFFGGGLDKIFGTLGLLLAEGDTSSRKESTLAILNGVLGDYLENSSNPLSIPMHFRYQSKKVNLDTDSIKDIFPEVTGKILLMVHGLCMNDEKWNRDNHDHGDRLAAELKMTPVYLNYNSGRHISKNGRDLNLLLDQLISIWPLPIEEFHIVAHSMGGLVSRSAIHYGQCQESAWVSKLNNMLFLGTPHHGASLERAGNYLDLIMESTPYIKPFARLTKIRSSGITDLRYGNLIDEDWEGTDRFEIRKDSRVSISLPQNVNCYNIVARLGNESTKLKNQIVGDGLVSVNSALGYHKNKCRNLFFNDSHNRIYNNRSHMDLLSDLGIYQQIKTWLTS